MCKTELTETVYKRKYQCAQPFITPISRLDKRLMELVEEQSNITPEGENKREVLAHSGNIR